MIKCFIYWLETEKGSCHKTQQRNSFTVKLPVYMAMSRGLRMESAHQEQLWISESSWTWRYHVKPLPNQRQKHLSWAVEKNNFTDAQWFKFIFSVGSKFFIEFGNQGIETQNPRCLKSTLTSSESVMSWIALSACKKLNLNIWILGDMLYIYPDIYDCIIKISRCGLSCHNKALLWKY